MTILGDYLTVKEMVAVEMNAEYLGVSTQLMMENAGRAIANEIAKRFPRKCKVVSVSGLTGNGGDAFTAARHLACMGYNVESLILGDPKNITLQNSRVNYNALSKMRDSVKITTIKDSSLIPEIQADVIIDGLIGTSLSGPLRPPFLQMVQAINKAQSYRVSVDIPTGMEADTGAVHGEVVDADLTLTFHKPKMGYKNNPAATKELIPTSIGIPPEAERYIGPGDVYMLHPMRSPESHKGMWGSLLVVGGSETYSGAPTLSSLAAYRMGLDLVYTAVPETAAGAVAATSPSMITVKLKGERLTPQNLKQIEKPLEKVSAVAVGPGLGMAPDTIEAVKELVEMVNQRGVPLVLDADGLKAYAENPVKLKVPTVFTPHNREFILLTGRAAKGSHLEKGSVVQSEAKKLGSVVLLKGDVDVISNGKYTRYNWTGNPGMTVGGTGDVLTGIVGAYLAQKADPFYAAGAAAFINGRAGDMVAMEKGYHMLPEDLIKMIPVVVEDCLSHRV
ncbi:NAD(P)H-hydrate dehydratase [Candidatus Bathyarchaeota archaeon]|nr:MAG: NAD(P)H-hydrate dehydratase [Candidatus Bathyarchaeota archaeon]